MLLETHLKRMDVDAQLLGALMRKLLRGTG
jgi:hypothetical protein